MSYFTLVKDDKKESANNMLVWLTETPDAENNTKFWERALNVLAEIEKEINPEMIVK